jgi:hypothetical protein
LASTRSIQGKLSPLASFTVFSYLLLPARSTIIIVIIVIIVTITTVTVVTITTTT